MSNMPNTILFSEVPETTYISHDGEVISKRKAEGIIKMGLTKGQMYTITDAFISSVLDQVHEDVTNGIDKEAYTADNSGGLLIIIDI
ncbi:hypothetical protein [Bacillus paranthracis]|uniref:hypothetical protein n=1 Tax=Bacillus paranthracis TaxID=2026186 RepID=UPI00220CB64F|nr:hypothetical protein [Bacillus paranthracis]UXR28734.1 hypothetical protein [Bacillus phage Nachito]